MAAAVPFLQIAGTVISAIGALQSASSQRDAANYNAAVASQNATIARQQGEADAAKLRRQQTKQLGDMRAAYAANGISLEGSAIDVLGDTAGQFELDIQNARYNAELKAIGYGNEAQLQRSRASSAETAGYLNAAGTIIGGTAGYVDKYGSPFGTQAGAPVTTSIPRRVG
jgi:hypothetical protein